MVALVGGTATAIFLLWPDAQPKPDENPPPPVALVDSDVDREQNVKADVYSDTGIPPEKLLERASVVSAVLRNSGDNPVLVTHADVRLSAAVTVGCDSGSGLATIQAQYDVKFPVAAAAGYVATRKMKYTLPPHSQERVAFTVGPEKHFAGSLPKVYTFTIDLHMDDGSKVTIPEVSYLSPLKVAQGFLDNAKAKRVRSPACLPQQARAVSRLVEGAARPSPELREFSEEFTRATAP
ncbi:hypothetical protein ACIQRZ_19080 [Streptomyces rubiginosohelvolus]|uniref:hypothetical protein n=1 Tax=Streptomyces rubiginosohelvolus TaxID=67362 RepID=UPI00381D6B71